MGCTPSSQEQSDHMAKSEKVMKSALLIQKWYRRYSARLEARRLSAWKIFQSIEYAGEQDQLKLYNFFNTMLSHLPEADNAKQRLSSALNSNINGKDELRLLRVTDPESVAVESLYNGPKIKLPLDRNQIEILIDAFKKGKQLHAKYVLVVLHETRRLLLQKANINHASTSTAKQITICGDIHGNIENLFTIFYKNGLPGVDNPYVFNGDFVDRGAHSVEVAMVLFSCFIVHPNDVYLNRGNHEDHIMNARYGFIKEVMFKYKEYASKICRLFEDVWSQLPLATVIDTKVFVAHGGISDKVDLGLVSKLNRCKFKSVLRPPHNVNLIDDINKQKTSLEQQKSILEWRQVLDLLWSDPKNQKGCTANTFRGGGCYFGEDTTTMFLEKNGLTLLVRSHECKQVGYEFTHHEKVLTIFSASNYYGEGTNKGAYINLDKDLKPHIVQFSATKASKGKRLTTNQRVSLAEESALKDLREKIYALRLELTREFKKYDPQATKFITITEWCDCLSAVLKMDLPWRTLRPKLARGTSSGLVMYESTFDMFKIQYKYSESGPSLTETLYRNRDSLGTLFRLIDKDNSGQISMQEFEDACEVLSHHSGCVISKDEASDLAKSIDINKDGFIDFNEFLEAFRLVSQDIDVAVAQSETPNHDSPGGSHIVQNGTSVKTSSISNIV